MKTKLLVCSTCGNSFEKPLNEYNRKIKLGKKDFFCSLHCAGKRSQNVEMILDIGKSYYFKGGENKITTQTGKVMQAMKEFSRRIRRRKQFEKEISPEDLFEIWNKQKGRCAHTNVQLVLPFSSMYNDVNNNFKASIDRINPQLPYSVDNIQFTSISVNYLKNNMTELDINEFFTIVRGSYISQNML
jgi:hypothetical protein